jgi:hypothetical protein
MTVSLTRTLAKTALLGLSVLAWTLPVHAQTQRVAMPGGEVLTFNVKGGLRHSDEHSTAIMNKWGGPVSVAWRILMEKERSFIWDPDDKEIVAKWVGSQSGKTIIDKWMTKGDSHGNVFPNADRILRNYFAY